MIEKLESLDLLSRKIPKAVIETIPQAFEGFREAMTAGAISAMGRGLHWNLQRPVKVGCSILALGKELDLSNIATYTGANYKLGPEILSYPDRKCGEMDALESIVGLKDSETQKPENRNVEIEQGDLGFIMAVLTVSEAANTGEPDTVDHNVLYPCKQCQTNYRYLLGKGIVSEKTIISSLKVNKRGKAIRREEITVGELLEKFKLQEERNLRTIRDLLQARDEYTKAYEASVVKINSKFSEEIEPHMHKLQTKSREDKEDTLSSLQQERLQLIYNEMGVFKDKMVHALKSAVEEGLEKQRVVESLGLKNVYLDLTRISFKKGEKGKKGELEFAIDALLKPLIENLPASLSVFGPRKSRRWEIP